MTNATTRLTAMNLMADEGLNSPASNRLFFNKEVATQELLQMTNVKSKLYRKIDHGNSNSIEKMGWDDRSIALTNAIKTTTPYLMLAVSGLKSNTCKSLIGLVNARVTQIGF